MSSYFEERNRYWTIYPEHLDYRLSRRLGRKVPLKFAVIDPKLEEIILACKSLKLNVIVEKDKHHPANWIEKKGRIKIPKLKKISKRKLLKLIAHRIKLLRKKELIVEDKKVSQVEKILAKKLKRR